MTVTRRGVVAGGLWVVAAAALMAASIVGNRGTQPARAAGPVIGVTIARGVVRQGEGFKVTVRSSEALKNVTARFVGRSWPLYVTGQNTWTTFLGTDPTMPVGRQAVAIEGVTASDTMMRARREVNVTKVTFPSRRITFDPQIQKLITPEAVARERRAVTEALRVLHPEALWDGPWLLPVDGRISSPYGTLSVYQGRVSGFHGGADIAADAGTPVKATGRGIVRLAEELPLSGNAVIIDHGLGVVTFYPHMQEVRVPSGQRVDQGDVVGLVGSTGLSTGPHLHWELRVNGIKVDPLPWTK